MAEKITVEPLFKDKSLSSGESITSRVIDLREISAKGDFALSSSVRIGTAGTLGTTVFTYLGCAIEDGNYVTPSAAVAIGTNGTGSTSNIVAFSPVAMPFIKIKATQTGILGTAGNDSKVTAELFVR